MRRRRSRRRLGRALAVFGGLALIAGLAAAVVVRVAILSAAIEGSLASHGFADAHFRIASVGVTTTRIVDIRLGAELAAKELTVRYDPLRLLRLTVEEISIAGLQVDLAGDAAGPLARLFGGDGARESNPQLASLPRLRVADSTIRLPGDVTLTLGRLVVNPATATEGFSLSAAKLAMTRGDLRIAANGLSATVGLTNQPVATFAVESLSHDVDEPLMTPMALTGTAQRHGETWSLAATAAGAHDMKIELQGSYRVADGMVGGRITMPPARFIPGEFQPGDVVPALGVMQSVSGTIAGHVAARWQPGHPIVPEGALHIDDVSFEAGGLPIEGLTVRATLLAESASSEPVIRLDDAHMVMAGGRLAVQATLFRPLAGRNRLTLQASDLDLSLLLGVLDMEGVSGEGKFAGALPLLVTRDDVAVEAGRLDAQGSGVLHIESRDTAAALAQGGADTSLLLEALKDFRYERLALSLDKPLSGESRLTLNMLGHNPAVLDGHPFQINVTVTTNLDKMLGFVAQGGRLSQDAIRAMVGARH